MDSDGQRWMLMDSEIHRIPSDRHHNDRFVRYTLDTGKHIIVYE